jgi:hypothetical protein
MVGKLQFDTAGNRIWGTYYGGSNGESGTGVYADEQSNIYLIGGTNSTNNISTPGTFQPNAQGLVDGFVAKFNEGGARLWGTYYGGTDAESIDAIAMDDAGYLYIAGRTRSDNNIATTGCYQPLRGGLLDILLGKMTADGQRIWGSYFGGPNYEAAHMHSLSVNGRGDIYLASGVDTLGYIPFQGLGVIQDSFGGGTSDGFISKFDSAGSMQWFTFYGGNGQLNEFTQLSAIDGLGNLYIAGGSQSNNNITTAGSFQPNNMLNPTRTPFLVRIFDTAYTNSVVHTIANKGVSIYPNPTTGIINIQSPSAGICEVYNVEGKLLLRKSIVKGRTILNMPATLSAGVYFVKCRLFDGEVVTERVVYR